MDLNDSTTNLNNVVEALNRYIELQRIESGITTKGKIILLSTIKPCVLKSFSNYILTLYYTSNGSNIELFSASTNSKSTGLTEEVRKELEIDLIQLVFKFIEEGRIKELINT